MIRRHRFPLAVAAVLVVVLLAYAAAWWAVWTVGPQLDERARLVACQRSPVACITTKE